MRLKAPGQVGLHPIAGARTSGACWGGTSGTPGRAGDSHLNGTPTMKPNEHRERISGAGRRRVLVHFEIACAAAIPIHDASCSSAARHASVFMPNLLVRQIVIPHGLRSTGGGSPIGSSQAASEL
jgi:hypothetical protein